MPAVLPPPPPGEDSPDSRKRQEMLAAWRLARHAARRKAADDRPDAGPETMNAAFIVVVQVRPGDSRTAMTHRLEVALCDYADEVIAVAPLT